MAVIYVDLNGVKYHIVTRSTAIKHYRSNDFIYGIDRTLNKTQLLTTPLEFSKYNCFGIKKNNQ